MHDVLCAAMCVPAPSQMAKVKPVALGALHDLIRSSRCVVVQSLQNAILTPSCQLVGPRFLNPITVGREDRVSNYECCSCAGFFRVTISCCECGEIWELNPGSPPDKSWAADYRKRDVWLQTVHSTTGCESAGGVQHKFLKDAPGESITVSPGLRNSPAN